MARRPLRKGPDRHRSVHERAAHHHPAGHRPGPRRRLPRRRGGPEGLGRPDPGRPPAGHASRRRHHRGTPRGNHRLAGQGIRQHRHQGQRGGVRRRRHHPGGRLLPGPRLRPDRRIQHPGQGKPHLPPPARRRRRHQPMELSAAPLPALGGAGTGPGQRRRHQTGQRYPGDRRTDPGPHLRGGRPAGRCSQRGGRRRFRDRRRLRHPPGPGPDFLHGVDAGGPERGPARRRRRIHQARRAGTGRQQPARRPRRRRPGRRSAVRGAGQVPAPGPDLHGREPDHRRSAAV